MLFAFEFVDLVVTPEAPNSTPELPKETIAEDEPAPSSGVACIRYFPTSPSSTSSMETELQSKLGTHMSSSHPKLIRQKSIIAYDGYDGSGDYVDYAAAMEDWTGKFGSFLGQAEQAAASIVQVRPFDVSS